MLGDRTYQCECGYELDRDTKSSVCIRDEGLKQIPAERREFMPGDIPSSTFFEKLSQINGIKVSKIEWRSQEAPTL